MLRKLCFLVVLLRLQNLSHPKTEMKMMLGLSLSMSTPNFLLLLHLVVVSATSASSSFTGVHAGVACAHKEREALLAFKQGITGDPGDLLATWKSDEPDCCRWGGVQCSNLTGHVLELHLVDEALAGEISHSLLAFQHLEHLDLRLNSLQARDQPARSRSSYAPSRT